MMSYELLSSIFFFGLLASICLAYGVRVAWKGHVHFDRVERQGGSLFLSKKVMAIGYWFFQPFARFLVACRVTPNQISGASLFFGLVGSLCLAFGHFGTGALFSALSGMMDSLDGLVARLTGRASDAGEVLDATIDRYVEFFMIGALVFYYRHEPLLLSLALAALMGSFIVSYSSLMALAYQVEPPQGLMRRPERAFYLTVGAALSAFSLTWVQASPELAHPMIVALALVAAVGNFSGIERLVGTSRLIRLRSATSSVSSSSSSS